MRNHLALRAGVGCEMSLEAERLGRKKVTAGKKQMRGESQGMSMLCCTGVWVRMGRDSRGASLLPLTALIWKQKSAVTWPSSPSSMGFASPAFSFCHSKV